MNLANLPNLTKRLTFYAKYPNLSLKCSLFRFKKFQNEIKFKHLNFDMFKAFLILTEFGNLGKFGRKIRQIRQIWQLSMSFKRTRLLLYFSDWFKACEGLGVISLVLVLVCLGFLTYWLCSYTRNIYLKMFLIITIFLTCKLTYF